MSDFKDAYNAGADRLRAQLPTGLAVPMIVTLDSDGAEVIQALEAYADRPMAKRGTVKLFDERSFCSYVNEHKEPTTEIFADVRSRALVAVIDHHAQAAPGWGRFRVELVTRVHPIWTDWVTTDKKALSQVDFAHFIENHIQDIADPSGGVLLEMITQMEVKRTVDFASGIRLDTGQHQLTYHEVIEGSTRKGQMKIPPVLVLGLIPFEGAEIYRIEARLRYRITDGKLVVWYELVQPDRVLEAAFRERIATVDAGTGQPALAGEAPGMVTTWK